jgi:hypothetical protein
MKGTITKRIERKKQIGRIQQKKEKIKVIYKNISIYRHLGS